MDAELYVLLALGGIAMVYLLHKFPQLAAPALVIAAILGAALLFLS